ncbi:MAG TPA: DUF5666 domain-containing protein [Candidatus Limnocylindrales bacterium]|jgi:hypothetical protein
MLQQPTTDQPSTIDQPSTSQTARRAPRRILLAVVLITASAFLTSAGLVMANDGGIGPGGIGPDDLGAAFGFGGPGVVRGGVRGQITITSISGNDLALKTTDGWTRTISVSGSTTITKAGQTIAVGDLAVGDTIRFSQTASSDGSYTIDAVVVVVPTVGGTVTQVGSGGFTLTARDGATWTITTNGTTAYQLGFSSNAKAGTAADVKVGGAVIVQGASASNNAMTAATVRVQLPRVGGQVTAKDADSITVTRRDGTTTTIHVSAGTTYQVVDAPSATLADISVGMIVMAEGSQRADGSIDATTVVGGNVMRGGRGFYGPSATPNASPSDTTNG